MQYAYLVQNQEATRHKWDSCTPLFIVYPFLFCNNKHLYWLSDKITTMISYHCLDHSIMDIIYWNPYALSIQLYWLYYKNTTMIWYHFLPHSIMDITYSTQFQKY